MNSGNNLKTCSDCEHYSYHDMMLTNGYCRKYTTLNIVRGTQRLGLCDTLRKEDGECGHDAKGFARKHLQSESESSDQPQTLWQKIKSVFYKRHMH